MLERLFCVCCSVVGTVQAYMTFREVVLFLLLVTSAILLEYFYYVNFDTFGERWNRTRKLL